MVNLKSRIDSLAFSSGVILFGRIFGKFANIAGLALLARELGGSEFGLLMLAYTIATVIGLMSVLGIPNGLASLLPKYEGRLQTRILVSGLAISTGGGLLGLLLLFGLSHEIGAIMNEPGLAEVLIPFAIFSFLFGSSKSVVGILRGHKLSIEATLSRDIIAEGAALAFLVIWLVFWKPLVGVYLYWLLIPMTTIVCGAVFFVRNRGELSFQPPRTGDFSTVLRFSWPLTVESSFVVLMANADVILIGIFLSATPVGIYKAAQPIAMSMIIILTSFTFLYLPLASEMYEKRELTELNQIYKICTKWVVTFSIPITAVIIAYSGTILETLYGPEFSAGATALSILTVGVFLRTFFGPNGAMIKAISKTTVDLYASVTALALNLGLNVVLIPRMGMEGAAIATAVGFTVFNLIEVGVTYVSLQMQPISRANLSIVVVVALFGTALRSVLDTSIVSMAVFAIAIGTVSLLSAAALGNGEVEQRLFRDLRSNLTNRL